MTEYIYLKYISAGQAWKVSRIEVPSKIIALILGTVGVFFGRHRRVFETGFIFARRSKILLLGSFVSFESQEKKKFLDHQFASAMKSSLSRIISVEFDFFRVITIGYI